MADGGVRHVRRRILRLRLTTFERYCVPMSLLDVSSDSLRVESLVPRGALVYLP